MRLVSTYEFLNWHRQEQSKPGLTKILENSKANCPRLFRMKLHAENIVLFDSRRKRRSVFGRCRRGRTQRRLKSMTVVNKRVGCDIVQQPRPFANSE